MDVTDHVGRGGGVGGMPERRRIALLHVKGFVSILGRSFRGDSASEIEGWSLMKQGLSVGLLGVCLLFGNAAWAQQWSAPTAMKKLGNGLVVVVSEDHS